MKRNLLSCIILIQFISIVFSGCSNMMDEYGSHSPGDGGGDPGIVSTPAFTPAGGMYNTDQNVEITSGTAEAAIYYTTDGTDPTTSSTLYTSPIPVEGIGTDITIKAIAVREGLLDSGISSASYFRSGIVAKNAVGATDSTTLRTLDYTPDDANSIFVSKSGSDMMGTGTQGNPVASINQAITLTDAAHQKVVIMDSGTYEEKGFEFAGNFNGLYAALGEKPVLILKPNYEFFEEVIEKSGETFNNAANANPAATALPNGHIFIAYVSDWNTSHTGNYKILDP